MPAAIIGAMNHTVTVASDALVERCSEAALALLKKNLTASGILAATPNRRAQSKSYDAVFARDAGICILAMARSADPALIEGARSSLLTLAQYQAKNGQIPKFVMPENRAADFWYVGCIDATMWWLIAMKHLARLVPEASLDAEMGEHTERALHWLRCQEHPWLQLVSQNEASDWADIMPRSGFVLYSNALWYYVKRLYDLPGAQETREHFNHLFFPFSGELADYRRLRLLNHFVRQRARNRGLYLSFVNFSFWGEEGDVFGNLLAVLCGLAGDARASGIMHSLESAGIEHPQSVRVTLTPIEPYSPLWRTYMGRHRQNMVYQYHNGGCWPMVGGFWVMALSSVGDRRGAHAALERLAETNALNGMEFNEWFHGSTGEPMGMTGQSWNAASFLLALASLEQRIF
ncbi:MAG: glycoside hydrolase 100 family protein [Rhodospirillaceae bacterium]